MQMSSGTLVNTCFYTATRLQILMQKQEFETLLPYSNFVYSLTAKETKRQYPQRVDRFLSYLGLESTIEVKTISLYAILKIENNDYWLINKLLKSLRYQKERVSKGDTRVQVGKVSNYFKAIKIFCEMNNVISVNWKLISSICQQDAHPTIGFPHEEN